MISLRLIVMRNDVTRPRVENSPQQSWMQLFLHFEAPYVVCSPRLENVLNYHYYTPTAIQLKLLLILLCCFGQNVLSKEK